MEAARTRFTALTTPASMNQSSMPIPLIFRLTISRVMTVIQVSGMKAMVTLRLALAQLVVGVMAIVGPRFALGL